MSNHGYDYHIRAYHQPRVQVCDGYNDLVEFQQPRVRVDDGYNDVSRAYQQPQGYVCHGYVAVDRAYQQRRVHGYDGSHKLSYQLKLLTL